MTMCHMVIVATYHMTSEGDGYGVLMGVLAWAKPSIGLNTVCIYVPDPRCAPNMF